MKELLAFAVISCFLHAVYPACLTCAKGPSCTATSQSCSGQGYCAMAWGTVKGVATYYRGCAGYRACVEDDGNCSAFISGAEFCNFTCCIGDDCNSKPFPPLPTTEMTTQQATTIEMTTQVATTQAGMTTSSNSTLPNTEATTEAATEVNTKVTTTQGTTLGNMTTAAKPDVMGPTTEAPAGIAMASTWALASSVIFALLSMF